MSGYRLHQKAREDLDRIWRYLAEEATPATANKLEDEFFHTFALLATQPGMGFQRPNLTSRPLRFRIMREYLIAYAAEHHPLFIVAVIHGRRHPRTIARILAGRQ